MPGVAEDGVAIADFDQLAQVHDGDPVAYVTNDAQIMADEQVGEPEFVPQILKQADDLRLDRDIEGRDRLVTNDEVRPERQGPGDADALALTAAHFVGIAVRQVARKATGVEQGLDPVGASDEVRPDIVNQQGLGNDIADAHAWIE